MAHYHLGEITRNSLETLAVLGLRLIVQVTMLFLLARYLGPNQFGVFAGMAALAVGLGTLSSFGTGFIVLAETAQEPENGQIVLAQAMGATVLSALILGPIYLGVCYWLLGNTVGLTVQLLLIVSELLLIPWLLLLIYRLQGLGQIARSQKLMLFPLTLRLVGLVGLALAVPQIRLIDYAMIYATATCAGLLLAAWQVKFALPSRWRWPSWKLLAEGAGYAAMNFTAVNPTELDKTLALRLLGSNDSGLYAFASRALSLVVLPVSAMVLSAQPRILAQHRSERRIGRLIGLILGLAFAFGCVAGAMIHVTAPILFNWAMGDDYQGIDAVVALSALIAPFLTARIASGGILQALRMPWLRTCIELGGLIALIALSLALVPMAGLPGLVYAVLITESLMAIASATAIRKHLRHHTSLKPEASASVIGPGVHQPLP